MMIILIDEVTEQSLRVAVQAVDIIRQQRTLTRGDGSFVSIAGKTYQYEEVREIWNKYAPEFDDIGCLRLPFAYSEYQLTISLLWNFSNFQIAHGVMCR